MTAATASAQEATYAGQVTDALRNPTHKLAATAAPNGHATGDLLFLDRDHEATAFRTCVTRDGGKGARGVHTCFTATSGDADTPTITPLRFKRGRYVVTWKVAGETVAHWRFSVV
ncbi:MAG TPA: hypothetical protein VGM91_20555 [Conexibacter sp.]